MKKIDFKEATDKLRQKNRLFDQLMNELGGFDKLPKHLQDDAIKRMGIKKVTYWVKDD